MLKDKDFYHSQNIKKKQQLFDTGLDTLNYYMIHLYQYSWQKNGLKYIIYQAVYILLTKIQRSKLQCWYHIYMTIVMHKLL